MNWSMNRTSRPPVAAALAAAAIEAANHGAAVGIWVVWLGSGRVLACEWNARLDIEAPEAVPAGAREAVVVAIAPQRLANPVTGRACVIGEYLEAKGFRVHVVHVRTLREGALWTSLRGRAVGGVVPDPRTSWHRPRLPHLGAAALTARVLVASCAVVATVVCATVTVAAPPVGQPGPGIDQPLAGQAGVTAPPRSVAPVATPPADVESGTNVELVGETTTGVSPQFGQAVGVGSQGPAARPSAPIRSFGPVVEDPVPADPGTLRLGAAEVARPEGMPAVLAAREREWNDFLVDQVAVAAEQAGLGEAVVEPVLGTAGQEDPVPMPQELVWAQAVATDPQLLVPVAVQPLISEVAAPFEALPPQAGEVIDSVLALFPPA